MELINNEFIGKSHNNKSTTININSNTSNYDQINFIRADDNSSYSLKNSESGFISSKNIDSDDCDISISVGIYRYKFTNEFTAELFKFSKIHQYDHRKGFKEAWQIWIEENSELIDEEVRRLVNLGYDGNIVDKMFKSARYYFRKKSTEIKEPIKRRNYVGSLKDLLDAMDNHIKTNIVSGDFKPSDGFDDFCNKNINILKEQITQFCRAGITDSNEIKSKIKKTYKNRYFLFISK